MTGKWTRRLTTVPLYDYSHPIMLPTCTTGWTLCSAFLKLANMLVVLPRPFALDIAVSMLSSPSLPERQK